MEGLRIICSEEPSVVKQDQDRMISDHNPLYVKFKIEVPK